MDSFIRNVCRFLFVISLVGLATGFVLSLFINTANAATTKPFKTSDIGLAQLFETWTTLEPSSVNVDFETTATTPQGQQVTRHTTRPVPLNKARLGSLAKSAVGGPVALAATAAFLAYDYFYNDETDEWEKSFDSGVTGTGTCTLQFGGTHTGYTFTQCYEHSQTLKYNGNQLPIDTTVAVLTPTAMRLNVYYPSGFITHTWVRSGSGSHAQPYLPGSTEITDDQAGDAIKNAPHQTIQDVLNDPISTGTWRDRWPEMEPIATDIEDSIGYDVEGTPTDNLDPTIIDGSTATPKPVTQTGSTPTATEWPTFCSWAGVVCDFIDWFKDEPTPPESPDLPITEVNPVDWESGLGTGSCPANPVVEMMGTSFEYDLTNACWGASNLFQPILIFLSLIAAAYIIIGARD